MTTAPIFPPSPPLPATASSFRATDSLLLVAPGLIWGASFLFIAEGLEAIGPFGLTFFRVLVGFATLALLPGARRAVPRESWPAIALLGAIWIALPLGLYPFAEQRVSTALTGMMNGAIPLLTAAVAALLARRAPTRGESTGLGVGLLGTLLVAAPTFGEGQSSAIGIALIVAALVSLAVALNLARPLQQRHGALPVLWRAQAVALLLTAPLGLPELAVARWTPGPLLSLLALGALGTGLAYALLATAAGRLGATRASSTNFLIPGVALLLGVTVRGEEVTWIAIAGAAIAVAGAHLVHRAHRAPRA
jgi:drug/metabolite transporter (DMT)-like permease